MSIIFIGLGSQPINSIPYGALSLLMKADSILIDIYTSPWREEFISKLKAVIKREVKIATRSVLEDIESLIEKAKTEDIVIICLGDPFIATTHNMIRMRAVEKGVNVKVIYSSSFVNVLFGELGLHFYKLGFIGTIMDIPPSSLVSIYEGVKNSLERNRHSILLLEYDYERRKSLSPSVALRKMVEIERSMRAGLFEMDLPVIIASRVGYDDQAFIPGYIRELLDIDFGEPPHSIVIPAQLHFTEAESLKVLHGFPDRYIKSFGVKAKPLFKLRAELTIQKTERAIENVKKSFSSDLLDKFSLLLENVECYLEDAKRFLNAGEYDLALMEACYAEGLLDSLRLQGYDIKW